MVAHAACRVRQGTRRDGLGLIHPVVSYLDVITIAFDAERELLGDPEVYRDCLQRSYDALDAAAA